MWSVGCIFQLYMLSVVHSRRYTNVLSWEWVGCKSYVGGNRRVQISPANNAISFIQQRCHNFYPPVYNMQYIFLFPLLLYMQVIMPVSQSIKFHSQYHYMSITHIYMYAYPTANLIRWKWFIFH